MKIIYALLILLGSILAQNRAFPGAEGYGAWTRGGATNPGSATIALVTNLNDAGAGSFRQAVSDVGNDGFIIVQISGQVELASQLVLSGDRVTYAFQTAPGDGLALSGQHIRLNNAFDVIIRGGTFRRGDNTVGDAFETMSGLSERLIFDHNTYEWGNDESGSIAGNIDSVTIQYCIFAEALDNDGQSNHAYLARIGSTSNNASISAHNNLFAHGRRRAPKFVVETANASSQVVVDYVNNVTTGWVNKSIHIGSTSDDNFGIINIANNFLAPDGFELYTDTLFEVIGGGDLDYYLAGNIYEGNSSINSDNSNGYRLHPAATMTVTNLSSSYSIADSFKVETRTAGEAYTHVLTYAGPIKKDSVTANIIANVHARTGALIDTEETHPIGWPQGYNTYTIVDTDSDGMEDWFEAMHGTDPATADGTGDVDNDGYLNIEEFINGPWFFPQFYTWQEMEGFFNNNSFSKFRGF